MCFLRLLPLFFLFVSLKSFSQRELIISDNVKFHHSKNITGTSIHGHLYIDHNFKLNPNKSSSLKFGNLGSWTTNNLEYFIDGYSTSYRKGGFKFPTGNKEIYKPLFLSNSYNASARFYYKTPPKHKNTSKRISDVLKTGYWEVNSKNRSKIRLTYFKEEILSKKEHLTIIALRGNTWITIPSKIDDKVHLLNTANTVDIKNIPLGITSINEIPLNSYKYFAVASLTPEGYIAISNEFPAIKTSTPNIITLVKNTEVKEKTTSIKSSIKKGTYKNKKAKRKKTKTNNSPTFIEPQPIEYNKKEHGKKKKKNKKKNKRKSSTPVIPNYTLYKQIYFPFNEYKITEYSKNLLILVSKKLKNSKQHIKLVGHTDSFGSAKQNEKLGMLRASEIKKFLQANGIKKIDITLSKGESEQVLDCSDCTSRETLKNRRVQIFVSNKKF